MSRASSQRDMMRALFRQFGGDKNRTVAAYAAAERRGEVDRLSNVLGMTSQEYATRLFADGTKKGWLG